MTKVPGNRGNYAYCTKSTINLVIPGRASHFTSNHWLKGVPLGNSLKNFFPGYNP